MASALCRLFAAMLTMRPWDQVRLSWGQAMKRSSGTVRNACCGFKAYVVLLQPDFAFPCSACITLFETYSGLSFRHPRLAQLQPASRRQGTTCVLHVAGRRQGSGSLRPLHVQHVWSEMCCTGFLCAHCVLTVTLTCAGMRLLPADRRPSGGPSQSDRVS